MKNIFMKRELIVVGMLIVLGAIVRILFLGKYPSGFFRDEAALGYNAYSIWATGKDEFGYSMPLVFRSFEVFFLPLYVYISAPIVGILGLSTFSARLLSSISGILLLPISYFIAKKIWNLKAAIFSVFVVVISPWQIFYSRGAFEGNLALMLFACGFLFWLIFIKKLNTKYFFISIFFFLLSMYAYQAERLVVPVFAFICILLEKNMLWRIRSKLVIPSLVILILLLPLITLTFKPAGYHRSLGVSIFADSKDTKLANNKIITVSSNLSNIAVKTIPLYLSYFSPRNLFVEGDYNRQRAVDNYSVLYAWMLPFLIWGIWKSFKENLNNSKYLFIWMFLGPLPAAFTLDPFHTYRSLLLFMPLSLFIAFGIYQLYLLISKLYKYLFLITISLIGIISLTQFLYSYLVITPATYARDWDYGYNQIVQFIGNQPVDTRVVVNDNWTESYIHFLFFAKVNPSIYQDEVAKLGNLKDYYYTNADRIRPIGFSNFEFRKVDWASERGDSGTIFVMTAELLPESEFISDPKVKLLKEIKYPNGKVAYRIIKIND